MKNNHNDRPSLGQLYLWLHRRAEFLRERAKEAAADSTGQSDEPAAAITTQSQTTQRNEDTSE